MTQRFEFDILNSNKEYIQKRAQINGRSSRNEATWLLNELIQNHKDSNPLISPKWMPKNQSEITEKTFNNETH